MSPAQAGRAAEKTGKVVRNDEVGPGIQAWQPGTTVDAGDEVDGGAEKSRNARSYGSNVGGKRCPWDESQERRSVTPDRGWLERELWRGAKPRRAGARWSQQCETSRRRSGLSSRVPPSDR
jgi:hypothetical protein